MTGNGVRNGRVWAGLLGVERTTVERVEFDEDGGVVAVHVKPHESERRRCPHCRRRCRLYDSGDGRRRWRALDLGTVQVSAYDLIWRVAYGLTS